MMKFRENEDAVSPVIGVILMVAITVILAAVIAAFVFGMGSNVGTTKTVAATAQMSGGNIVVTYQGGPDHAAVTGIACSAVGINSTTPGAPIELGVTAAAGNSETNSSIGDKWSVNVSSLQDVGGDAIITVVATFSDGTEQIILDKTQNIPKKT